MIKKSYIKLICLLLCSSFLLYGCGLFSKSVDDNSSGNNIQGTLAIFEPSSQPNAAMAMSMSISNLAMNISGELANLADATVCVVDIITHIKVPGIECVQSDSDGRFVLPVLDSITVDSQLIRAIKGDKIITSIIDTSQETVNGDPFTTATVAKVMALIEENDSAEFLSGENLAFDPVKKSAFLTSIKSLSEAVKIEIEKISPEDINDFTTLPSVQAEGTEVDSTIFKSFITDSSSLTIASDDITSLKTMMQSIQSEFIETVTIMKEDGTVETIDDKKTRVAEEASTETDTDTSLDTSSTDTSTSDTSLDTSSTDTSTSDTSTDSTDDSSTTPTNLAATDITLINMSIAENEAANTVIGTITITDDGVGTNSLTLTGTDAGKFTLDGTTLKTAEPFDYETNSSYTITLTATDGSLVFSKDLTITITDIAEVIAPEPLIMVFSMTAGEELFLPWAAAAITEADIDYEVDWGDDSAVEQKGLSHTYASADSYEVTITHKENKRIPNIKFHSSGNETNELNLTELKEWGSNKWTSLKFAFTGCSNLTTISETDAPDLSNLSDTDPLRQLFQDTAMNSNVNHWDVSQVQSLNGVFRSLSTFNNGCAAGDTSCPLTWDVSSATNMNFMFLFANNFNQDIGNWDVSQVTSMSSMLKGTTSFNQNISEWDVSNVTNFTQIFTDSGLAGNEPCWFDGSPNAPCNTSTDSTDDSSTEPLIMVFSMTDGEELFLPWAAATITEADIDYEVDWGDGSAVEQKGLSHTYASAGSYDVTITHKENKRIPNISFFNGNNTSKLNLTELKKWGSNKWTSFTEAFYDCSNLTAISETDAPDLSNLSDTNPFNQMFQSTAMNSNVSHWDISQVTSLSGIFRGSSTFNNGCAVGDTSCPLTWDVSNVTNMNYMFQQTNFNQDIGNWDVSQVTDISHMLRQTPFNQDINGWDVSNVTNMGLLFFQSSDFNPDFACWYLHHEKLDLTGTSCAPSNVSSLAPFISTWETTGANQVISLPFANSYHYTVDWGDSSGVETNTTEHTYTTAGTYTITVTPLSSGGIPNINFQSNGTSKTKIIDVTQWGDNQWTSMESAFKGCTNLTTISATDAPDLSLTTTLKKMFYQASNFNSDLNHWDVSNIQDISMIFFQTNFVGNNMKEWKDKMTNVTNMSGMFNQVASAPDNLNEWDMSQVTNISSMFYQLSSFNEDISNWDVSNVTDMRSIFKGTAFNQDISGWDVSNVTNMAYVFAETTAFNQDLNAWDVSNVTDIENIFKGATSLDMSNISSWPSKFSNLTNMSGAFSDIDDAPDLTNLDTSKVTKFNQVFKNNTTFNQDISGWDISSATRMDEMFSGATSFNQNLNEWDISNITLSWAFNNTFTDSDLAGNEPCWFDGSPNAPCD